MKSQAGHSTASARTAGATVLAPIAAGTSYVTITELLTDGRPLLVATMTAVGPVFADRRRARVPLEAAPR